MAMNSRTAIKIIYRIAYKRNLNREVVRKIVMSQYKGLIYGMSSSDAKTGKLIAIRLPFFGVFWIKKKRAEMQNRRSDKKNLRLYMEAKLKNPQCLY